MPANYQPRLVDGLLARRLIHHPAVLLVGPRATGKTTTAAQLARSELRLDDRAQAVAVEADADAALRGLAEPVLIDEWQIVPDVLGAVKRSVDADSRPGRFLITGSVRGDVDSPMWPGTGRLLRVAMFGLTVGELRGRLPRLPLLDRLAADGIEPLMTGPAEQLDLRDYAELAAGGGFPQPVLRLPSAERGPWLESYLEQLLTQDVAMLATHRDPQLLRRYLESCALNTAGVTDHRSIYSTAGVAKATGEAYDRLLRNLLIIDTLPAWWTNHIKRLVRGPKRYLVDPSLVLAALRVGVPGLMKDGDLLGRIIDTFVVAQLRAQLPTCETQPRLYHLRQEKGQHEVDVIVEYGGGRVFAFEIKANSAPSRADARHLAWLRAELGDRFIGGAVLHTGPRAFPLGDNIIAAPISALWS
ncbi:ATP-binding protein [Crossiella sp. CA198]|uniref:ATP-binding protein n=1 Tax=Crossiella sp. CA198 TaxID=3455607 RepID=UPI003F8D4889